MILYSMIYLSYDNETMHDGIGAQAQRILSIYWITQLHHWSYIHSPIIVAEHISNPDELVEFNRHIQIPSDHVTSITKTIQMKLIDIETIKTHQHTTDNILFKITFAHNYVDSHPQMLTNIYPHNFEWVQTVMNSPVIIALHIRRGDVSQKANRTRYVPLSYYLSCIKQLSIVLTQNHIKHEIHIYTEGTIEKEIYDHKDLVLHIDGNPVDTFIAFVNADILFTGFSSFSYTPVFLRKKGCILYTPFWHQYPKQAVRIHNPQDIVFHQRKIINSLKS